MKIVSWTASIITIFIFLLRFLNQAAFAQTPVSSLPLLSPEIDIQQLFIPQNSNSYFCSNTLCDGKYPDSGSLPCNDNSAVKLQQDAVNDKKGTFLGYLSLYASPASSCDTYWGRFDVTIGVSISDAIGKLQDGATYSKEYDEAEPTENKDNVLLTVMDEFISGSNNCYEVNISGTDSANIKFAHTLRWNRDLCNSN